MQKHTPEEKAEYFKNLREKWQACKEASMQDEDAKAKYQAILEQAPDLKISYTSFYFTLKTMQAQELTGVPYVHAKTYKGWQENGYNVKKGSKSTISGVTWIKAGGEDNDDGFLFPKEYRLFHADQVEELATA